MNVVFRVDASNLIGTGHVMRCRTLANALRLRGAHICFITRKQTGHLTELLVRDGFQVKQLPQPDCIDNDAGYASWLGVSQEEDARQTVDAFKGLTYDLLFVDHYALDVTWESLLRPHASKIFVIDDIANRNHDCDFLLDQNYSLLGQERYKTRVPESCRLILGPRYALLNPEYAQIRKSMVSRAGIVQRVLIYMGGSDSANITGMALNALSVDRLQYLDVDVVIGPNFVFDVEIFEMVRARARTQIFFQQPHLGVLLANADIVVGAGGATTWERLCLGVSSLVISTAENQVPACKALSSSGLIRYLGRAEDVSPKILEEALVQELVLAENPRELQIQGDALVDGLGTCRVVEVIKPSHVSELGIRNASASDVMSYFNWVNDPKVRDSALQSTPIDFATHVQWFEQRLIDPRSKLLIMEIGGLPVAQLRLESKDGIINIDYSVDELVRGRGWGRHLIEMGMQSLTRGDRDRHDIRAVVKLENIASQKIFESLGFTELSRDACGNIHYRMILLGQNQKVDFDRQRSSLD
jgi:UDP-2,4-diacetamido-2,4,6-trideoxy-beta-L-altropyranose hydrolase